MIRKIEYVKRRIEGKKKDRRVELKFIEEISNLKQRKKMLRTCKIFETIFRKIIYCTHVTEIHE